MKGICIFQQPIGYVYPVPKDMQIHVYMCVKVDVCAHIKNTMIQ